MREEAGGRVGPRERGLGFEFENGIVGGVIPKEFIKPTEQGIKEALENGVLAGYPVIDVKVQLIDGSYRDVDSRIALELRHRDPPEIERPLRSLGEADDDEAEPVLAGLLVLLDEAAALQRREES